MPATDPYVGEICAVAFDFAPLGWAICDGSQLLIAQYRPLFTLLGTTYGGDGITTFGIPDLRGRAPVGAGQGNGLDPIGLGQAVGAERVAVLINHLPPHGHPASLSNASAQPGAFSGPGSLTNATGAVAANPVTSTGAVLPGFAPLSQANAGMAPAVVSGQVAVGNTGGGLPLPIRGPALGITYLIALEGVFPARG
ncbi:phage tail protein [Hydrogenophaga sp. T2]|uniref:phage tail protein n=1 Tax=Hydrogenophaga sp. T2 TaxID=3132823 RepID=UPI003CF17D63